jgi:hypothetical protein
MNELFPGNTIGSDTVSAIAQQLRNKSRFFSKELLTHCRNKWHTKFHSLFFLFFIMSRKRTYNIGDLLDDDPKYLFNNYVKIVEVDKEKSDKFKLTRHRVKYSFSKIEHLADPIAALRQCFQESIDKAIEESKKNNIVPNKIGLTISSVNLNPDFQVRFTEITENTVDAIFNRFRIIQEQYPDRSLHSQPFDVEVTLVNSKAFPKEQQTTGSGRGIRDNFRHQIDEKKLIKIENYGDNYCLFYALVIMRIYQKDYLGERKLKQWEFDRLSKNPQRIRILVEELLDETGIAKNLDSYSAEEFCPVIENLWAQQFPLMFKIFIFSEYGTYRPVYMSKDCEQYKYPIILYHKDDHFDGIRSMHKFFNQSKNYCFTC